MTKRLTARVVIGLALAAAVLTGCSSEGADTDCGLDQCTVTFGRGVDAQASVLGVEAQLVDVDGDQVTLEVAGEQLTLTVGQGGTEVSGLDVRVKSVTDSNVVVEIARA